VWRCTYTVPAAGAVGGGNVRRDEQSRQRWKAEGNGSCAGNEAGEGEINSRDITHQARHG
jgi:hypothetical protein